MEWTEEHILVLVLGILCRFVVVIRGFDNCLRLDDSIGGGDSTTDSNLFQYDPVEIGHVRFAEIEPGRYVRMKTLAVDPPIFEIPNFLSDSECEYIKELAIEDGLEISRIAYKGSSTNTQEDATRGTNSSLHSRFNDTIWKEKLVACDKDDDELLDPEEALACLPNLRAENVTAAMLSLMLMDLELDRDSDGRIGPKELWRTAEWTPMLAEEVREWIRRWDGGEGERFVKRWKGQTRISDQTWLSALPEDRHFLRELQDRVVALTKLPPEIVYTSEPMQVVRYRPGGHYHAHYDTDDVTSGLECRHTAISLNTSSGDEFVEDRCRLCRMITILYYLNDVVDGGETAFPFADLEYGSPEYEAKFDYDYTDLKHHCYDSNLVIQAKRGTAVLWYSHYTNPETGWMGPKRLHSLHGGCEVNRGVKWIANTWISVDDVYSRQRQYMDSLDSFLAERAANSKRIKCLEGDTRWDRRKGDSGLRSAGHSNSP
ncbi:transmembrane prolyl 4-hydroxylase-like [Diadema antillarum]|uniref:transmembrane prolyl 4-hydroxylase-like n=1 Tax=Diadema antillarum TaxID=105358 RepID=UPI003A83AB9E